MSGRENKSVNCDIVGTVKRDFQEINTFLPSGKVFHTVKNVTQYFADPVYQKGASPRLTRCHPR